MNPSLAAQRALELPVRMGIATGEADLRGADYFGAVLNRAYAAGELSGRVVARNT
jgi:class 3 adenylate cyclase